MTTNFARLITQQQRLHFHTANFLHLCLNTKGVGKGFLLTPGSLRFPQLVKVVYPSFTNTAQVHQDVLKAFQESVELTEQIVQCFDAEGNPERGWRVEQTEELQQAVLTIRAHLAQFYAYLADPGDFKDNILANAGRDEPEWKSKGLTLSF